MVAPVLAVFEQGGERKDEAVHVLSSRGRGRDAGSARRRFRWRVRSLPVADHPAW